MGRAIIHDPAPHTEIFVLTSHNQQAETKAAVSQAISSSDPVLNSNHKVMHSLSIDMLLDVIIFCFARSWQLLFTFFCRFALSLTLRTTEKVHVADPERAVAYGW